MPQQKIKDDVHQCHFCCYPFKKHKKKVSSSLQNIHQCWLKNGLIIGLIVWPCTDDVSFEGVACDIDAHSGFER
jgi:hypothetical protein